MKLWVAQGFGIGRIPVAPGTFGSVVGLIWFGLLLATGKLWVVLLGIILGIVASVWLCDFAERFLGRNDPGSVVLDEIAAIPVCFLVWLGIEHWKTGSLPGIEYFCSRANWPLTVGVFLMFRIFDVWKPWPVRQSQCLAGGLGITIDDLLAAVYVNLVVAVIWLWKGYP